MCIHSEVCEYNVHVYPCAYQMQGFICPICMEALRSAEALQVHWEAAHSSEGGGASAAPTKALPPQYVEVIYMYM